MTESTSTATAPRRPIPVPRGAHLSALSLLSRRGLGLAVVLDAPGPALKLLSPVHAFERSAQPRARLGTGSIAGAVRVLPARVEVVAVRDSRPEDGHVETLGVVGLLDRVDKAERLDDERFPAVLPDRFSEAVSATAIGVAEMPEEPPTQGLTGPADVLFAVDFIRQAVDREDWSARSSSTRSRLKNFLVPIVKILMRRKAAKRRSDRGVAERTAAASLSEQSSRFALRVGWEFRIAERAGSCKVAEAFMGDSPSCVGQGLGRGHTRSGPAVIRPEAITPPLIVKRGK
jgi:hypothetical protein